MRSMAANTHDRRALPLSPWPLLLMMQEITTNSSKSPRKPCRTSTATRGYTPVLSGRCKLHWATLLRLFVKVMIPLLLAETLWGVAAEEVVDIRPVWMPLEDHGDAGTSVAEVFRSSEVLQMYHLQATAQLYEQGGLNHDMSFFLTAVGFYSMERPDTKISMAYHPTNMTISLLPVISEDGRELRWDHQAASTSYVMDVDQAYWTAGSYMGETTGAFFSYAVEFSLDYHVRNPRYQPFSVYEDYPGRQFLTPSSCDEYVWALFSAAQTRGVRLAPVLLPPKHTIVIYSHSEPKIIVLNGDGDGDGDGGGGDGRGDGGGGENDNPAEEGGGSEGGEGDAGASSNSSGPGSTSLSAWSSSSLSSSADKAAVGEGGDQAGEGGEKGDGGGGGGGGSGSGSTNSSSSVEEGQGGEGEPEGGGGEDRRWRRRQRGRTLLWGSSLRGLLDEAAATPAPGVASAVPSGEDNASDPGDGGSGEGDGEGGREAGTAGAEGVVTLQPTVSSTEASVAGAAPGETPAPEAALDDWQQVVAYYQSLQLCLQERKFSFVTSLKDFAQYFDCLDDVAFISIGPHEYYKVNLTSTKLDHISLPEELPEVPQRYEGFTWVDTAIAIWILMIMACGIHGLLWQAAVIQHWLKSHGYGEQTEEVLPEEERDPPTLERHPSMTRQITTEYLRLGHIFLGKTEDYSVSPSSPRAASSGAGAAGAAASAAATSGSLSPPGKEVSSEASRHFGGRNGGGRPPQHPPPARGAQINGATKTEGGEKGRGAGMGNPRRGRRVARREEGEEGVEMRATTKTRAVIAQEEGEKGGGVGPSSRSAGGGPGRVGSPVERGNSLSPPRPMLSPPQRNRASGPYRGGVDGGGDRWIGFAGSPRGERQTPERGRQSGGGGNVEGEELLGNSVASHTAASGSPRKRQHHGDDAAVEFAAAPHGETWAGEESEAFLEEGLEEMLSGTSR